MKILFISGSPRRGNTEYLLSSLFDKYEGEKEIILLRERNLQHCLGCLNCHTINNCFLSDEMSSISRSLKSADIIVFGMPNYFESAPGIARDFMDRCHPFYSSLELKDKKIYYIFVGGGDPESTKNDMPKSVYGFTKHLKLNNIGMTVYRALNKEELRDSNVDIDALLKNILGE